MAGGAGGGAMSADACVLEYLLEQDRLPDDLIKQFYDFLLSQQGDLPPLLKLRLMLRVLRGTAAAVDASTLNTLDYFARNAAEPGGLGPAAGPRLAALRPPEDLYNQARRGPGPGPGRAASLLTSGDVAGVTGQLVGGWGCARRLRPGRGADQDRVRGAGAAAAQAGRGRQGPGRAHGPVVPPRRRRGQGRLPAQRGQVPPRHAGRACACPVTAATAGKGLMWSFAIVEAAVRNSDGPETPSRTKKVALN